jgi:hypothetical protein
MENFVKINHLWWSSDKVRKNHLQYTWSLSQWSKQSKNSTPSHYTVLGSAFPRRFEHVFDLDIIPSSIQKGIHTGNKPSTYRDPYRRWSSDGWIQCNCCMDPWSMEWMIDWTLWIKDSNPWPCTIPPLTPKCQRLEPTPKHYTTIDDPRKDKDSNPGLALHQHWLPQSQRFEPRTMHYTTIDLP